MPGYLLTGPKWGLCRLQASKIRTFGLYGAGLFYYRLYEPRYVYKRTKAMWVCKDWPSWGS